MKQGIHPQYVECTVTCSCGNTFKTHATVSEMKVELCNECHPFYTGQQKFVDTGGRVQRFADKFGGAAAAQLKKARRGIARIHGIRAVHPFGCAALFFLLVQASSSPLHQIGAKGTGWFAPNGREAAFSQIKAAKINQSLFGRLVVVITWRLRSTA